MVQGAGRRSNRSQDAYSTAPALIGDDRPGAVRTGEDRERCTSVGAPTFPVERVLEVGVRVFKRSP